MNFAALTTELADRGFDYLSASRLGRYINVAYHELCDLEEWPFLEASASGAAPLTISDVRTVLSVYDQAANANLTARERRGLVEDYRDLTTTGPPRFFYLDGTSLSTYPVGGTLNARYIKVPPDLAGDTDTPLVPPRFHYVIVDIAARRAYIDSDAYDKAQAVQAEVDRMVAIMRDSLLQTQTQDDLFVTGYGGDY